MTRKTRQWLEEHTFLSVGGCLVFAGPRDKDGYGKVWAGGRSWRVHRYVWFMETGEDPVLLVRHTCDTRPCCNPRHLALGTHQDNMDDMKRRGRQAAGVRNGRYTHPECTARGEKHASAKLSERIVVYMRRRYVPGTEYPNCGSIEYMSREFEVTPGAVYRAVTGKTWKSVK